MRRLDENEEAWWKVNDYIQIFGEEIFYALKHVTNINWGIYRLTQNVLIQLYCGLIIKKNTLFEATVWVLHKTIGSYIESAVRISFDSVSIRIDYSNLVNVYQPLTGRMHIAHY